MGPFTTYAPPGVFTRTLLDPSVASLTGSIRIPIYIGVGQEEVCFEEVEMFRGSSAVADNLKPLEDVSSQMTGTNSNFTVSNIPITNGEGTNTVTNDPLDVEVFINSEKVAVSQLDGETGQVFLANIPLADDEVLITYYYNKTDTLLTDDVSIQADGTRTSFKVTHVPIVDGTNGGITTTDPQDVTVTVNGTATTPTTVDGGNGMVTLSFAPLDTDTVLITYYYNKWANTADDLPLDPTLGDVTKIIQVGFAPGRSDYIPGTDFVLIGNSIHWGNTYTLEVKKSTPGSTVFDDSQINPIQLIDNVGYFLQAAPFTSSNPDDADKVASGRYFVLPFIPTNGSGRGTPININSTVTTDNWNLIQAYVGPDVVTAEQAGEVRVNSLDGSEKLLELETAPAPGQNVYVTQYYSIHADDCYTFEVAAEGAQGVGTYTVESENQGDVNYIKENPLEHNVTGNPTAWIADGGITWPDSFADLQTLPGFSPIEKITVTFVNHDQYIVTSSLGAGGSSGTGQLDQTYIDGTTGVRFTVQQGSAKSYDPDPLYDPGDYLVFETVGTFPTMAQPMVDIPGLRVTVTDTDGCAVGDQAELCTYNMSGQEPPVGDFYYVDYCLAKKVKGDPDTSLIYETTVETRFTDVVRWYGDLAVANQLTLAAYIAFLNGASIIALKQVKKMANSNSASVSAFLQALVDIEDPIPGDINPNVIVPLTSNGTVQAALLTHVERQSSIRYRHERVGIIGTAIGTDPDDAQELAPAFNSNRMLLVYPDGAIIPLVDELGREVEVAVDGTFLAVAFSAINVSPQFDVATSMTRKTITGFSRLIRRLSAVEANQVAVKGITVFDQRDPVIRVRHSLTTNPSNVLTRELHITTTADFIQQSARDALDQYIGVKLLPRVLGAIADTLAAVMQAAINAEVITAYTGITVTQDSSDPSIVRCEAFYQPIFSLTWIVVTFNLRAKL